MPVASPGSTSTPPSLPRLPRIAFCITCKGRTPHLERTLPQNLRDNLDYPQAKFIVVNYNSKDNLAEYLDLNHHEDIESGRLVTYRFTEPGQFRMAHAKNIAHRCGMIEGADILVNLDADNFTGKGFATFIAESFIPGEKIFLWARMVKDGEGKLARGISGRIVVTRNAFLLAGGYNERFAAWSPDDKDFHFRLQKLGFLAVEIPSRYLHAILHNDRMRFREYPEARQCDYRVEEVADDEVIANAGRIGVGVVYRNRDRSHPIDLSPLPTRVFGIGMHKTGTTSLDHALTYLGYDSAHWVSAHWARAIWLEMRSLGYSPTLQKSYALSDLPIPLLYRELDRAYPGSKFILTLRDEQEWLASVRNHWGEKNKFRPSWDSDPFSNRIHRELYGQKHFDAEIFLARYRRHNEEVRAYFRDRPQDLLVMDLSAQASWWELCGFLKQSVPEIPYPKAFVTE